MKKIAVLPGAAQSIMILVFCGVQPSLIWILISAPSCLPFKSATFLKMMARFSWLTFSTSSTTMLLESLATLPSVGAKSMKAWAEVARAHKVMTRHQRSGILRVMFHLVQERYGPRGRRFPFVERRWVRLGGI